MVPLPSRPLSLLRHLRPPPIRPRARVHLGPLRPFSSVAASSSPTPQVRPSHRRPYSTKFPSASTSGSSLPSRPEEEPNVLVEEGGTQPERPHVPGQYTELENEDQMVVPLREGEEVGGERGSFVKIVETSMLSGLLHHKSLVKESRHFIAEGLVAAGLLTVQVGSFDNVHYQPQLDHTGWILSKLGNIDPEVHFPVQISGVKSLERLLKVIQMDEVDRSDEKEGQTICDMIEVWVGCTETYSITHQTRPIRDQLLEVLTVVNAARDMGFLVRANLQVTIECPYEGAVPPERVADIAEELVRMGCFEVSLADTTGRGDPGTVGRLVREVGDRIGIERVACNFYDTFGLGTSNVLTALSLGVRTFDASVGGLGGAIFSPGATGQVSTEDVVYTLHNLGYHTGVNLVELSKIGGYVTHLIDTPNNSRAGRAVLARMQWEDEDEIKQMKAKRDKTVKEMWDAGAGKWLLFCVVLGGLMVRGMWRELMGGEVMMDRKMEKQLLEEALRQEMMEMAREGDEFAVEELAKKGVVVEKGGQLGVRA